MQHLVPPPLEVLELRCVLRAGAEVRLPLSLGKILRNAFGQALQHVGCPPACWNRAAECDGATRCSYRALFEGTRSDGRRQAQEPPRPYAIVAPPSQPLMLAAGSTFECGIKLFGRARVYLPVVLAALERLAADGLGVYRVPMRLETVEACRPGEVFGPIIAGAGCQVRNVPVEGYNLAELPLLAAALDSTLSLHFISHLRLTRVSGMPQQLQFTDLVWAIARRLEDLNANYGDFPWRAPLAELTDLAAGTRLDTRQLRWEEREAVSLRNQEKHAFLYSGLIGRALLHDAPLELRTFLLAGALVQVGKYTVQGNGRFTLASAARSAARTP